MAILSFPSDFHPALPLQMETETNLLQAKFGDGYTQKAANGLNAQRRALTVTYPLLLLAERNTLEAFLTERGGWQAFWWTVPGETLPRAWTAPKWTTSREVGVRWKITISFVEELLP